MKYSIINLDTKMYLSAVNNNQETVTTNRITDALLFKNKEEAENLQNCLNSTLKNKYQILSLEENI